MRKYVFIGCGGFFGAVFRYLLEGIQIRGLPGSISWGVLIINVSGSLMLAFILTIAYNARGLGADIRLGVTAGLLGAFTTFSTLCRGSAELIRTGDRFSAVLYLSLSIVLGLGAACAGAALARGVPLRDRRKAETVEDSETAESGNIMETESDVKA